MPFHKNSELTSGKKKRKQNIQARFFFVICLTYFSVGIICSHTDSAK